MSTTFSLLMCLDEKTHVLCCGQTLEHVVHMQAELYLLEDRVQHNYYTNLQADTEEYGAIRRVWLGAYAELPAFIQRVQVEKFAAISFVIEADQHGN